MGSVVVMKCGKRKFGNKFHSIVACFAVFTGDNDRYCVVKIVRFLICITGPVCSLLLGLLYFNQKLEGVEVQGGFEVRYFVFYPCL